MSVLTPLADRLDRAVPLYDTAGKTIVVTGANTGIGYHTAAQLAAGGGRVVITARNRSKGEVALASLREATPPGLVELAMLDLASLADVRRFAAELLSNHDRIDVLVNNAGLIQSSRSETVDGFETTFAVNHLGPFLLTNLLLDRIRDSAPARIVNVSSVAHKQTVGLDFDNLQHTSGFNPMRVYGRTKLCNIYFTRELARRLDGSGVTANALHPGGIRSGFGRDGDMGVLGPLFALAVPFLQSSQQGARTSAYLAASPEAEGVTGEYFAYRRRAQLSKAARDDEAADRLWEVSAELVGL